MITNMQTNNKESEASLVGKQQLLIKSQLSQRNALVAKQQLAIKSALAEQKALGANNNSQL